MNLMICCYIWICLVCVFFFGVVVFVVQVDEGVLYGFQVFKGLVFVCVYNVGNSEFDVLVGSISLNDVVLFGFSDFKFFFFGSYIVQVGQQSLLVKFVLDSYYILVSQFGGKLQLVVELLFKNKQKVLVWVQNFSGLKLILKIVDGKIDVVKDVGL